MKLTQIERFFQYVQIPENPFTDCWEFLGWRDSKGYGRFRLGGRGSKCIQAHRYMMELWLERPLGRGLEGDHICENRSCVSPLHLIEVTPENNKSQRYGKRYFQKFEYAA